MLFQRTPTTDRQHARNNALQLVIYKMDRPALYAKMLAELPADERARVEATVAQLEAEEGSDHR
jgi:hypothetical protein